MIYVLGGDRRDRDLRGLRPMTFCLEEVGHLLDEDHGVVLYGVCTQDLGHEGPHKSVAEVVWQP